MTYRNAERIARVRARIEAELTQAAAKPGVPDIRIIALSLGEAEPELRVIVTGKLRVLGQSQEFLDDEPDNGDLRKVSAAPAHLVAGDAPRVRVFHRGRLRRLAGET